MFGALTGLATSLAAFLILGISGVINSAQSGALFLVVYTSQLLAGFVTGRFTAQAPAFHGGLAALLLFVVTSSFALAAGADPTFATVVTSVIVAAVIGSAGGALAEWRRIES